MRLKNFIIIASSFFLLGVSQPNPEELTSTCVACHGADGNSQVGLWPSLAGQNFNYLKKQLLLIQSGQRSVPEMTGLMEKFSEKEIEGIASFYSNKKTNIGRASKELVDLGSKLYYVGNLEKGIPACYACHSPKGRGNYPAGYPLLSGQKTDYISKTLKDYRSGVRQYSDQSAIMVSISYKLDDKEIAALASFINGLH